MLGIAFGVLAIGVIVYGFLAIDRRFSDRETSLRAMRSTAKVRIADARDGTTVRITGRIAVHRDLRLTTPISGRACVAYRVHVESRVRGRKSSHWRTVVDDRASVDFVLEDESGGALISARGADLVVDLDHRQGSEAFRDSTPALDAYLVRRSAGVDAHTPIRFREGALELGETVTVVGVARWEDEPGDSAAGFRDAPKRLVLRARGGSPVHVSDTIEATG